MIQPGSYDPDTDTVAVLQAAFDELCKEFQSPSMQFEKVREEIAKVVMEVAETGELDPDRIVIEARYSARKIFAKV